MLGTGFTTTTNKTVYLTGLEELHEQIKPHQEKRTTRNHFTGELTQFFNVPKALMQMGEEGTIPNQCTRFL